MTEAKITFILFILMLLSMTAGSYVQFGTAPACYTAGACFLLPLIAQYVEDLIRIKNGYVEQTEEDDAK